MKKKEKRKKKRKTKKKKLEKSFSFLASWTRFNWKSCRCDGVDRAIIATKIAHSNLQLNELCCLHWRWVDFECSISGINLPVNWMICFCFRCGTEYGETCACDMVHVAKVEWCGAASQVCRWCHSFLHSVFLFGYFHLHNVSTISSLDAFQHSSFIAYFYFDSTIRVQERVREGMREISLLAILKRISTKFLEIFHKIFDNNAQSTCLLSKNHLQWGVIVNINKISKWNALKANSKHISNRWAYVLENERHWTCPSSIDWKRKK